MDNGMSDNAVDSFQVSPQQERLWVAEPDGPTACTQSTLKLAGHPDASTVAEALRAVVARHESLRTTFLHQAGLRIPVQVVNETLEPAIETLDISTVDATEQAQRLEQARKAHLQAPFDLQQGPLVRATVAVEGEHGVRLLVTASALCADPASMALLLGEVSTQLESGELVEDPLQYADFSAWQHELGEADDSEAVSARAFWSELDPIGAPAIPFARPAVSGAAQEISI